MSGFYRRWMQICGVDAESRMTERETEFIAELAREIDRINGYERDNGHRGVASRNVRIFP